MVPENEIITVMILYADLKCPCCYKKVRKLVCKFPQIRQNVFDVDKNKVTIAVVCCDPEKLRDKLCCKGGGAIQSIEIVEPQVEKRSPPHSPKGSPKDTHPEYLEKNTSGKPESPRLPSPKGSPKQDSPVSACCQECYEGRDGGPCHHGYGRLEPPQVPKNWKPCPPKSVDPPRPTCCQECYEGRNGGPCHHGYGRPVPSLAPEKCRPCPSKYADPPEPTPMPPVIACCQECNEGRGGGPCHCGYGRHAPSPQCYYYSGYLCPSNKPRYVSRCDSFSEDNPQECSIM